MHGGALVVNLGQQRVAARRQQYQERRRHRLGLEVERRVVAVQVADGDQRQAAREGQRLGGRQPDQQCPDQARALGDGDGDDLVESGAGIVQRPFDHGHAQLQVPARGHLGHHPAVAGMQLGLGGDHTRPQPSTVVDQRGGGLVAGALDREDHATGSGSRHMIRASSRLSV